MDRGGEVAIWRYDPKRDAAPEIAEPGELDERRAVFLASPGEGSRPRAWIAVDGYDGTEATVLFDAPAGDEFGKYVRALVATAIEEATALGFTSLLAHWRAGWGSAEGVLAELGFTQGAPGMWRRALDSSLVN